jgi:serine/threonine protein kinase
VFRAGHIDNHGLVVLKYYNSLNSPNARVQIQSIHREKKALSKLRHPNIVKCYDQIKIEDYEVLELEFIDGKPADEMVRANSEADESKILEILFQVASALNEIHRRRIIHMNIKPANILVTEDFVVKLINFGICDLGDDEKYQPDQDVPTGTVNFIAYELSDRGEVTTKNDIWSLGITIFRLMTGEFPSVDQPVECLSSHLNELCNEMLNLDPEKRISAHQLLDKLQKIVPSHHEGKVTVKVKQDGKCESQLMRLPESLTIRDLVNSIEPQDGVDRLVSSNGQTLSFDCCLADLADQTIEIQKPIIEKKQQVNFIVEGLPGQERMISISQSATIGDFLQILVNGSHPQAKSVMINNHEIEKNISVSNYKGQFLFISLTPPVVVPLRQLDLVFVIDVTRSMEPARRAAYQAAFAITSKFRTNRRLSLEIASVCYRDPVDNPESDQHESHPFNRSVEKLREFLNHVKIKGGGDSPEDFVGAIQTIFKLRWRSTANHAIIWITDACAHGRRYYGRLNHQEQEGLLEPLVEQLAVNNVKIQAFDINHGATLTFTEMQKIYQKVNPSLLFKINPIELESSSVDPETEEIINARAHQIANVMLEKLQIEVDAVLENASA